MQRTKRPLRKPKWLVYGDDFLEKTPKAQSRKEIMDKLDFIKITNICVKGNIKKMKRQTGRKYLQKTRLIEDCYTKYTKNTLNSTVR